MRIIKALGSLQFAIFLILALAALLTVSTTMESMHGTPFAQKMFYRAGWFDFFLSVLAVNIFCAAASRWPFQKHHTGFVVTHVGILMLLAGSLISRLYGIEGQMTLFEGDEKMWILQEGQAITVETAGTSTQIPISGKLKKPVELPRSLPGLKLTLKRVLEHAAEHQSISEGGPADAPNLALQATLKSQTVGLNETFVLIENDPSDESADEKQIGPARVRLGKPVPAGSHWAELVLRRAATGSVERVALPAEAPVALRDGLRLDWVHYLPHAKVEDGQLINAPDSAPFNPAVQFQVSDDSGHSEEHTKLFLFPEYASLRGGPSQDVFGLDVAVEAHTSEAAAGVDIFKENGAWRYHIRSSRGEAKDGVLEPGVEIATGWMDITLTAKELFERAKIKQSVIENANGSAAALILAEAQGVAPREEWLLSDRPVRVTAGQDTARIALEPERSPLPFSLKLLDFRKVDYPGTNNPASFESDVILTDKLNKLSLQRTIRMNQPLDYAGYRVFQSSYIQDPQIGEASVFSVAKNPGIVLIYSGAVVIAVGMILLFYLHPFFTKKS